jgi:adenylate cyclase
MFTDIVGYTSLMGSDEVTTLRLIHKNRTIHQKLINKYHGQWLKEMGDGTLASFHSSSDAVLCAQEIQIMARKHNIPLRIGIHEGEMVFSDGDVFGDGVNVASRLESLAQNGCIIISESVYKSIRNKPGITAEFLEEKQLKNIQDPVKIYRVHCQDTGASQVSLDDFSDSQKAAKWRRYFALAGVLVVVLLISLLSNSLGVFEPDRLENSIVVFPFEDRSPDQSQEYLGEGMAEEVMTLLSRLGLMNVIARRSAFQFKGKNVDIRKIGKTLKVIYALEGSIMRSGDRLRVTAELVNTSTGAALWSEAYDREMGDIFSIQQSIAGMIVENMQVKLADTRKIITRQPTRNLDAYNQYLMGNHLLRQHILSLDTIPWLKSSDYFKASIALDSNYAEPYAGLAYWYYSSIIWSGNKRVTKEIVDSTRWYTSKALQLNPELAEAHMHDALIKYIYDWDWKGAEQAFDLGMKYNPSLASLIGEYSNFLVSMGNNKKSIAIAEHSIKIDPLSPFPYADVAYAHMDDRQFEKALPEIKKASELDPQSLFVSNMLLQIYAMTGRADEFQEEYARIWPSSLEDVPTPFMSLLVYYYAQLNRMEDAMAYFEALVRRAEDQYVQNGLVAVAYLGIKDYERAIIYIERSYAEREPIMVYIKSVYFYEPIRSDPRIIKIMKEMNF